MTSFICPMKERELDLETFGQVTQEQQGILINFKRKKIDACDTTS